MGRWVQMVWVFGLVLACGGRSQDERARHSDRPDSGAAGSASGSGGADRAGGGGSAGVAGGAGATTTGGSGGRGGTSGGGTGGDDGCPATPSDFCGEVSYSTCPETRAGAWYPGDICRLDAEGAIYSECSDGSVRFSWSVAGENEYELVYVNGELTYGYAMTYPDSTCRVGGRAAAADCESCDFCPDNLGGEGGAAAEACDFLSDGRIGLPR